ncbi:Eukaryotic translation initiation factor 4 gamma [Marasmius tenuissimus]|uniref:Eukaryotic translation initiation factor 4 gamma n=1 Tax=Marasmius tenuissimus TaxID=585030 RepID=A0ABR2ZTC2_9AGAR
MPASEAPNPSKNARIAELKRLVEQKDKLQTIPQYERMHQLADRDRKRHAQYLAEEDKDLECTICQETVKFPRILSCGHYFCSDCILPLGESPQAYDDHSREYKCPTCMKEFATMPMLAPRAGALADNLRKRRREEPPAHPMAFNWPKPHPELVKLANKRYKRHERYMNEK